MTSRRYNLTPRRSHTLRVHEVLEQSCSHLWRGAAQVVGVALKVAGLFISVAAMSSAYQLRSACLPNANQKRR